ncbi:MULTISPECIES: hypothetical protein [unclassified Bacillus (in: firmicutes)]|uniref:hypothetical protein n=1 Tax=unclassified Bacillus (in: firmicutes) TaxID=185979 RepID=UPI000D02609F|nr:MULTISPECIES: hypothetical protein [unclassified Bacillus (in: firmicutes)]PRS80631.1 hypothetical protein C6346_13050 [Bacillus sp. CJCL2]PRS82150.1 hypothetical protein C6348_17100 [Bacillus sp. YBWC18]PRS82199.1 hypothetical protein C6348_17350 [Bacillus sp. YBWC18]
MHIYYFDEKFKYQGEDVIDYDELPENATDVRPQKGLYLPVYDEKKRMWFESASEEYIESLQPKPPLPNDITTLKKQAALLTLQVTQLQRGGSS